MVTLLCCVSLSCACGRLLCHLSLWFSSFAVCTAVSLSACPGGAAYGAAGYGAGAAGGAAGGDPYAAAYYQQYYGSAGGAAGGAAATGATTTVDPNDPVAVAKAWADYYASAGYSSAAGGGDGR
jgi:hypothetical protein